ncbi:hypothetical protein H311_00427 [Anncaliia algerae PRA109]|nr:hypothetical protein H311_00427 [Anncaliia algerae PRA109]
MSFFDRIKRIFCIDVDYEVEKHIDHVRLMLERKAFETLRKSKGIPESQVNPTNEKSEVKVDDKAFEEKITNIKEIQQHICNDKITESISNTEIDDSNKKEIKIELMKEYNSLENRVEIISKDQYIITLETKKMYQINNLHNGDNLERNLNVIDKARLYDSFAKKIEEKKVHVSREIKPIVVDENLRHLETILLNEELKEKYFKEKSIRANVNEQLVRILEGKESDHCIRPSEIKKDFKGPKNSRKRKHNKYAI